MIVSQTAALSGWGWTMGDDDSEVYTANGLNQHLTVAGASVSHDARGNMTSDGLGRTFSYDAANRLTSVSGAGAATLSYDPAGRLREVAGTATTRFLYDGADVIAEYDETDALLRRYVHGPGLDEPLIWYEGTGTGDRRFLLSDPRGSVVAVTDGAGDVTTVNKYDDYGAPGSGNLGRFQFTGQMWLAEAGLYHFKARAYHPALGRFMQADPIGYGDGMNMYAYVGNDPVNRRDPSGMCGTRLSVESSSAMCMLICANPADCYMDAELARLNGGEVGGGVGKIDNNTREMRRARFAAKLLGKAYQHFGENGLQAALWLLNNYRTVYYGFNGTAVGGVGVTGATGAFIDQDTGVSGQFVTIGFGVGANASFGFFFGAINRPWAALGGWYFQLEADIVAGSLGYVVGVDSCCMDGNFNPTATVNDARGAYVAVGPGAGVAATATYTWLDPDQ